jgi:Peroxin-3
MLNSISNYVYERRVKLVRTASAVGGLYLLGQYASARMADMSNRILEQRVAREKYVQQFAHFSLFNYLFCVACVNDFSRICRISHSQS